MRVLVPARLKNEWQVEKYVRRTYGSDVGTKATWKQAVKIYTLTCKRLNIFPVFVAHCYMSGQKYAAAGRIYGQLYDLADTQREEKDWYQSYLAYEAGCAFALLDDLDRAATWYSRSAEFVGHPHSAISYYAKVSAKRLKELEE